MLFRVVLLLAIAGLLTVFTLQNLTPLIPLVFLGIRFPALPLSWWVLGAIAAGGLTTLAIQVLFGLSNFVTGQTVRSRTRNPQRSGFENRWSAPSPSTSATRGARSADDDDTAWKDWRGYEAPERPSSPESGNRQAAVKEPVDDWERPPSEDWEDTTPRSTNRAASNIRDRGSSQGGQNPAGKPPSQPASPSSSTYSYSYREPEDSGVGKQEKVVDADFRVIVPPYRPLDEPISPPPAPPAPPPVEENADDWFEDSSDEFEDTPRDRPQP